MRCNSCLRHLAKTSYSEIRHVWRRFYSGNTSSDATNTGPLHGIRVLDLTRVLAGPYCSMILGDLGAEVIKIEKPGVGDDTRSWGPPFRGPESSYFLSINRNKKSVCINLKDSVGQDLVRQLAVKSDILLENYIPGKLSEMGLGYEQLSQLAPQLVYCSITGYGQTGPYAQRAGYDVIVAATGGLTHITGPKDGEPCKVGVAMTDLSTGLYAYGSVLAALLHRDKTGQGQHIDCNLLSTQVASLVNIASNYLNNGLEASRHGTAHPSIVPYQAFKTMDGFIMIGAGNDKQFSLLCKRLDLPDVGENPNFANNSLRVTNREELLNTISNRLKCKTTSDWLDVLEDSGIPYGPINNMQQVFSDPQVVYNDMIQEMSHPTSGAVKVAGPPVKFSETPVVLNHSPPTLGQHTEEVLQELLDLDWTKLRSLKENGVIE